MNLTSFFKYFLTWYIIWVYLLFQLAATGETKNKQEGPYRKNKNSKIASVIASRDGLGSRVPCLDWITLEILEQRLSSKVESLGDARLVYMRTFRKNKKKMWQKPEENDN